jgi:transglutaminase-like putative cysteine protease
MTAAPPGLVGASLLFWGWQTGNWFVAAALAVGLEGVRRLRVRFDLGAAEHARIADLCTVLFVASAALLAVNRGVAQGILVAFQWIPVALAPILAAQLLSADGRVPLSALFRHLRKLKRHDPATRDPLIDASAVYVAVALIAAGVANRQEPGYYAGVVIAAAWGLWASRPRHGRRFAWLVLLATATATGYAGHAGLAHAQAAIENWISEWYLSGFAGDPYRSTTDIGTIGQLKLEDAIVLRVFAAANDARRPQLLHRASYNTYVDTTWLARNAPMQPVAGDAAGLSWRLSPASPQWSVPIAARIERGRLLLALPATTARVTGLGARTVKRNALGAVHAEIAGDWVQYEAESAAGAEISVPPGAEELAVPPAERATFAAAATELGLRGLSFDAARRRIEAHFRSFSYATWRERAPPQGATPLGEFMQTSRAGHCEYFAAATTLLLRAAGIPARYATGFAVMEYSALEGAWVVRARHAHAWSRAWDGVRWVDIDTTPPVWFAEEEQLAPFWQKAADLVRWAAFRWSQRGEVQASDGWYAVLAVLLVILAWRMLRGRRAAGTAPARRSARSWQGVDSEFYAVERLLAARGWPRPDGTPLSAWLESIASQLPDEQRLSIREASHMHQRYRFDPLGLTREDRLRLRALCESIVVALQPQKQAHRA